MRAGRRNQRNRLLHLGVAVFSVALALGLTLLAPWLSPTVMPLFFVAVMVSAWLGGWEAGLLATVLSTLAISYFFIAPLYLGTLVRLSLFAIAAGLISWLN
jgi:K+-sensing histidine kinase KdpD